MYAVGASAQNQDVVEELLKRNADVNVQTITGISPLLLAAQSKHSQIMSQLLKAGARIDFQGGEYKNSILHVACQNGDLKSVKVILDFCSQKDRISEDNFRKLLYLKNKQNQTALEIADSQATLKHKDEARKEIFETLQAKHQLLEKEIKQAVENILLMQSQPVLEQKRNERSSSSEFLNAEQIQSSPIKEDSKENLTQVFQLSKDSEDTNLDYTNNSSQKPSLKNEQTEKSNQKFQKNSSKKTKVQQESNTASTNIKPKKFQNSSNKQNKTPQNQGGLSDCERSRSPIKLIEEGDKDYSKLKIGTENFKLVPKIKAQNANLKDQALNEKKRDSDNSRTVTEEDSADEAELFISLQKGKSDGIKTDNLLSISKQQSNKSSLNSKESKTQKLQQKQESSIQVVLTPKINLSGQKAADQVQEQQIIQKQHRNEHKNSAQQSNVIIQQLEQREPAKNFNNSDMLQLKTNNTPKQASQSQQSTQLNLMSALREENFITTKSSGNVFSVSGQELEGQKQYTQIQLQSKVQEAIPELARANHGFPIMNPYFYPQPSNESNKSGFMVNDMFIGQTASQRTNMNIDNFHAANDCLMASQSHNNLQISPINPNQGEIVFPFVITKLLDSKESQMQFIIDQLDDRLSKNENQLSQKQSEIEALKIQIMTLNEEKKEASSFCKALYEQSIIYYNNFKSLENEYISTSKLCQKHIEKSKEMIDKTNETLSIKGSGNKFYKQNNDVAKEQLEDIKIKLDELVKTLQESRCNIDEKKEVGLGEEQKQMIHQSQYQQYSLIKVCDVENSFQRNMPLKPNSDQSAEFQKVDQNLLIEMERLFESNDNDESPLIKSVSQVQNQLDKEIKQFRSGITDIMREMQPVKNQIIKKISQLIQKSVPDGDVRVYGSHATQLCLHWSDIDLVLIPPDCKHMVPVEKNNFNDFKQNSYNDFNGKNSISAMGSSGMLMYQSKSWLTTVFQELLREEQVGQNWITSLKFIETTAVPVIKLKCSYIPPRKENDSPDVIRLPDGSKSRYPEIIQRPINIDITLMTEHHNGINCVNLVKQYLKENQVIEPLILVLKQMLKVWGFNEPYNGGLSSYALFLMIVSFLQAKKKPREIQNINLGETLLEFMKYYSDLESTSNAIACALPGEELVETRNVYPVPDVGQAFSFFPQPQIYIDDPLNQNNNVGKSSYQFQQIKNILGMTYNQAFTGCFCSCHFNENEIMNKIQLNNYYSQLMYQSLAQLNYAQQICNMENYPQSKQLPNDLAKVKNADKQDQTQIAQTKEEIDGAQLLHTDSQPFRIEKQQQQSVIVEKCSCESILSRLIYGYKQYQIITQQQNQRGQNDSSNPSLSMNYTRQSRQHDPFMGILQMPMNNMYGDNQDF